jgi:hypothetical protein
MLFIKVAFFMDSASQNHTSLSVMFYFGGENDTQTIQSQRKKSFEFYTTSFFLSKNAVWVMTMILFLYR